MSVLTNKNILMIINVLKHAKQLKEKHLHLLIVNV